ncbi:hypothetical protein PF005_g26512 [Phytophthora fragariae]|uniref:Uncharacterized protein n=1 Tax=Phytophthora fragariae TaxID=53985 RepID=A0A6A4BNS0_9STRA|nr:hypothetical protein PF003_g35608 [Phytophthora fragariae]KAE8922441.1 hypothetical protein PF009_g27298 [Phytophthora fragariae]KAE8973033.1 hypothetical protein PF011_g25409 [Phytophthora fragariae]KAE9071484.1 hypothetical protein PF007_g26543 [Phytophthora fragariae]KAE9086694.1 hypothetical protein PF006_g25972 [Phytophthora fragariae]
MQVSDQPPDNPGEVIDVSTPSPPPERNKGDQLAGAKRHPELTNDQEEPQVTGTPKRRWTDAGGTTKDTTMATVLEEDDEEESKMDEPGFQEKQEEDPPTYEETTEEPLTFAEMYLYMHGELAGKELQDAKETVSVMEYVRSMFKTVFKTHPTQSLAESKRHYPELTDEETDQLLRLFLMDIAVGRADARKWRARLYDIVRSVYKTRRSMMDIVDHRIATSQAAVAPVVNAWTQQNEQQKTDNENDMDVDMTGVDNSPYRFLKSVYTASEITLYRKICETPYGFPSKIRKPTEKEKNIIRGLLEGSILCAHLPAFLKRVCTNAALRMIQNTIQAQVEGDLVLQLPTDFPVYPDFQSRERLVGMILLGIRKSEHPEARVVALLKNAKQVCYDKRGHAVHLIFWTREQAAIWGKEFKTLPFRNRNFALRNEHAEEVDTPMDPHKDQQQFGHVKWELTESEMKSQEDVTT